MADVMTSLNPGSDNGGVGAPDGRRGYCNKYVRSGLTEGHGKTRRSVTDGDIS